MPAFRPQNLNDVFAAAAKQTRQKLPDLPHNRQVAQLYRHSLKCLLSWAIDRDVFNEQAALLRQRFDQNRGTHPRAAHRMLQAGQDELFSWMHPDPYCLPTMPGGSKFMRNPPLPMDVCFPHGPPNVPHDAPLYEVNPDWSVATPATGRNGIGTVLVDFSKKNME